MRGFDWCILCDLNLIESQLIFIYQECPSFAVILISRCCFLFLVVIDTSLENLLIKQGSLFFYWANPISSFIKLSWKKWTENPFILSNSCFSIHINKWFKFWAINICRASFTSSLKFQLRNPNKRILLFNSLTWSTTSERATSS
jgi:hypothetical protein